LRNLRRNLGKRCHFGIVSCLKLVFDIKCHSCESTRL
jgi:hypothetical protein